MPERSRSATLEGARGVLVTGVVAYHLARLVLSRHGGDWGDVGPAWWPLGTARFGVDAFFVLAGFFVVASWEQVRARSAGLSASVREFAARRAIRILPPYFAMLIVLVPLLRPGWFASASGWADLGRLVTVQQYLDPYLPAQLNVPIWSLTTEVHFYLLVPLVAWALSRARSWLLVAPALVLAVWWVQTPVRGDMAASLLPGRLHQFLVGAAVGGLVARWRLGEQPWQARLLTHRLALPLLLVGLLAIGTFHGATYQGTSGSPLQHLVHPISGLLLGGVLVRLVCGAPVRGLEHATWRWLGAISFSLYLWHYPIIDHGLALTGLRGDRPQPPALVAAISLALVGVSVVTAALAHRFVEAPALRFRSSRAAARQRERERSAVAEPELRLQDA